MRTPAGTECRYYYEDFNRGRTTQECRLILGNPNSAPWKPGLCKTCPVPAILRANACPHMQLEAWVGRRRLVLPRVRVRAFCRRTQRARTNQVVADPMVGCGHCHEERMRAIDESLNS
jgi:hypothetical protein